METAPERSAIPTKADRSASASVMQQPYSEAREDDIGMTRAERTAASIPRRSAAHGLSRRVPAGFLYPRVRGYRNALARRCAPMVSGAGPRSDHRINCRRCEQCFAHCFGEGPAARRSPQIGIGLAARFAVGRRLLSLNYLRVVAFAAKLKTTLVTLTARAECGRSTVIRGRQNVNFERSN